MAVTPSHLNAVASTTATSPYSSGSISPAADSLLLAWTHVTGTAVGDPTVSGLSLTWTPYAIATVNSSTRKIAVYAARCGPTPGSGAVTFTPGGTLTGAISHITQVTGAHLQYPISQIISTLLAAGDPLVVPPSGSITQGYAGNRWVGGVANTNNSAATIPPPTDWTEFAESVYSTPGTKLVTLWNSGGTNPTSVTIDEDSTYDWRSLFLEIVDAAAPNIPDPIGFAGPNTGTTSITGPSYPAGATGDFDVAAAIYKSGSANAVMTGWGTPQTASLPDNSLHMSVWTKKRTGGESGSIGTATISGGTSGLLAVETFRSSTGNISFTFGFGTDSTSGTAFSATSGTFQTTAMSRLLVIIGQDNTGATSARSQTQTGGVFDPTFTQRFSGAGSSTCRIEYLDRVVQVGANAALTMVATLASAAQGIAGFIQLTESTGGTTQDGDVTGTTTGAVTPVAAASRDASAAVTTTGAVTSGAAASRPAGHSTAATAAIVSAAAVAAAAAAVVSSTAGVTSTAARESSGTATVSTSATVAAGVTREAGANSTVSVSAGIVADAAVTRGVDSSLLSSAGVSASASRVAVTGAAVSAAGAVTSVAGAVRGAAASVAGSAVVTAAGDTAGTEDAAAAVTASAAVTATAAVSRDTGSSLTATGGVVASADRTVDAATSVTTAASVTTDAARYVTVDGAFTAAGAITVTATTSGAFTPARHATASLRAHTSSATTRPGSTAGIRARSTTATLRSPG